MLLIVFDVAGRPASSIGQHLAAHLKLAFHEASDALLPEARAQLAQGGTVREADAGPWLEKLCAVARGCDAERGAVLACSALNASQREQLAASAPEHRFLFLGEAPRGAASDSIQVSAELPETEIVARLARALGRQGYDGATSSYLAEGSATLRIDDARAAVLVEELLGKLGRLRRVLLVPPDFTRFHSGAGALCSLLYRSLRARGAHVEILPATGTHVALTDEERVRMFPDVPKAAFRAHDFREDLAHLGDVPGSFIKEVSAGLVDYPIRCEVNRSLTEDWDRIISVGQLVPHEVIGIANHNKNIFVGTGGKDVIDRTHFLGAVCNMESIMGRSRTPVRDVLDYMSGAFGAALPPITYLLTVRAKEQGQLVTRGLYAGDDNGCFIKGAALAQQVNIERLPAPIKKAVVYLDPAEFKSTWLGNKAVYRTRLALADDAELLILAPGVRMFGEDPGIDRLIRRHGYHGTGRTLSAVQHDPELAASLSAAAHLIHGSSEGRFTINYATGGLTRSEVEGAGFGYHDPERALLRYQPERLVDGPNRLPDGEEIFFISNPALGLWALQAQFAAAG
jgi:nickel-dependent lactate racemase